MFHVPGTYSGGETSSYSWTQTKSEVELRAKIPADAASSVKCLFEARKLQLSFASDTLAGELPAVVVVDDCLWSVESEGAAKTVVVALRKAVPELWTRLFAADAPMAEAPRLLDGGDRASAPKSKEELLKEAKARAKGALDGPSKAKVHVVEGRKGEAVVLSSDVLPELPVVHVSKCDGCTVTLPAGSHAIKLQMEGCTNCTLVVHGKVLAETLEIWECTDCKAELHTKCATVQLDGCGGIGLKYACAAHFDRVMHAGARRVSVTFDDEAVLATTLDYDDLAKAEGGAPLDDKVDQFITRRVGGALLSELVIRLCNDFPTTQREAAEYAQRTTMKADKLDEVVDGMLGSSLGRTLTDAEKEQMRAMVRQQADEAAAAQHSAEQTEAGRHAARVDFKKNAGNEAFKGGNYQQAAVHYTEALALDDGQHALHSNRAACFLKLGRYAQAKDDAAACVKLAPDFAKGHFRLALALQALEEYPGACAAFGRTLELEPKNKDAASGLQMAKMQAERQRRMQNA